MSCNDIWAGVQDGSLFCAPTAAQRAEFISCAVQRMCNVMAANAKPCSSADTLLFQFVAALAFEGRVQQAACSNQPSPGAAGQPCAPGTPCCPQCQSSLQCSNGTCCAPPPYPSLGQQALAGCPCAQGLARDPATGACCPQSMTFGSPCTPQCPCPAPMQCVDGACCWPQGTSLPQGQPYNDLTKQVWNPKSPLQPLFLDFKAISGGTTEGHVPCSASGQCISCPAGESCRKMVRALDWELSKNEAWIGADPAHVAEKCSTPNGCVFACMCGKTTTGVACTP